MAEFLVETYASRETANPAALPVHDVARAADRVSQRGTEVRFLRAIFAPEEETCFYLFEAVSVDGVRAVADRAGLTFARIAEAARTKEGRR